MTIAPDAFDFVRELVQRESAIVLAPGKEYLVESRLAPLAREAGQDDVTAYVSTLRGRRDAAATRSIVEALTTNETSWFRDVTAFTRLRAEVLPTLATRRPERALRIWCAACSTGQEPYSVAIAALETPAIAGWEVEILATDLNEQVLAKARAGRYSRLEVSRGLCASALSTSFVRDGTHWQVAPAVAAPVTFRSLNLVRPFPPIGRFDLVLLRNVLIYFDVATKQDILRRVRRVMAPDGVLLLGAAESTRGLDDGWEPVTAGGSSVYRIREQAP